MFWVIVLVVAAICGILGFIYSEDGDGGKGFFMGAISGGLGCGGILLYLGVIVGFILLLIAFVSWVFG